MPTELERQLNAAKQQHSGINNVSLKDGVPSLFFSKKEAGKIDINQVYEAAMEGLNALAQYDSRFDQYRESILHPSSIDLQRELKTKEVRVNEPYFFVMY